MRRITSLAGCLLGLALTPADGHAAEQPGAKVDRVLLYGDQARVFRRVAVTLPAPAPLALADLPRAVDPSTVRVESKTAEVARVEIASTREKLPRQARAKELLDRLEALMDKLRVLEAEKTVLDAELELLGSLQVQTPPAAREGRAAQPEGIFVDAWRRILAWVETRSTRIRARLLALPGEERPLQRSLHELQVEARQLDLGSANDPVSRVTAALRGRAGRHEVEVSYLVTGVHWRPSYDLSYDPKGRRVAATTYALLRQSTGEDWSQAQLRFSTGTPAHLVAVPELSTITLGRKRDFVPSPRPRPEPPQATWRPEPPRPPRDHLVDRLRQVTAQARSLSTRDGQTDKNQPDRDADGIADEEDACPDAPETRNGLDDEDGCPDRGRVEVSPQALEERTKALKERIHRARAHLRIEGRVSKPDVGVISAKKKVGYDFESDDIEGELPRMATSPAPAAPPAPESTGVMLREESAGSVASTSSRRGPAQKVLPWTEEGYRPPPLDPDSPAAGAEGYRYTLYAPGRHTIAADGRSRRIPVLREQLQVQPLYRILPGLSPSAYLTAALQNTTGKPILRGNANLFAGAMYSGHTWLNTALPGKKVELPLGVDDAVGVVRHLRQKTVSQGVIFKDDISEYTVEIEVANHHRYPIQVEVQDQVPRQQGKKVEVRAFSSPFFAKPSTRGEVRWRGTLPASSVKKLSFTFQIVRPKDWDLVQHDG